MPRFCQARREGGSARPRTVILDHRSATVSCDAPSGTALSIRQVVQTVHPTLHVEIVSKREGDVAGVHILEARSDDELIELKHESFSRRAFAEGAVRAAEWIAGKTGVWDFSEIANQL